MSNDVRTITVYGQACDKAKSHGIQVRRVLEGFNLCDAKGGTLGLFASVDELLAFLQGYEIGVKAKEQSDE